MFFKIIKNNKKCITVKFNFFSHNKHKKTQIKHSLKIKKNNKIKTNITKTITYLITFQPLYYYY